MRLKKHRVFHCCPLKGSKAVTVKKERAAAGAVRGGESGREMWSLQQAGFRARGMQTPRSSSNMFLEVRRRKTGVPHAESWKKLLGKKVSQ